LVVCCSALITVPTCPDHCPICSPHRVHVHAPGFPASLRSALPYYMPPKQRALLRVYRAKVGRFQKYAILRALSSMKWGNTSKGWPMMGCDHAGRVPYSGRATVPRGAFLFREGVGGLIRGVTKGHRRYYLGGDLVV